ncbi:BA75_03003T0 [Komagataella pastoris]|uniref:BA75_03003T0 n=1 Tax=Komagataella pastoris TaxID=4922 RepID=A0A1B2JAL8_PICPA|nr:BA75_03003T0 [Komagataella pastoris]
MANGLRDILIARPLRDAFSLFQAFNLFVNRAQSLMFGHNSFLGTPKNPKKSSSMDFTPIGVSRANNNENNPLNNRTISSKDPNFRISPLHNHNLNGSSINYEEQDNDTILSDDFMPSVPPHNILSDINTNIPIDNHNLFKDNLVRQTDVNIRKLETENLNLKLQLTTLKKYLDSTPEDQLATLQENISLKEKLMQLDDLNQQLQNAPVQHSSPKFEHENATLRADIDHLNSKLLQMSDTNEDLEAQCERYKLQLEHLHSSINEGQYKEQEAQQWLKDAEEKAEELYKQLEESELERNNAENQMASYSKELEDLTKINDTLQLENESLRSRIQDIKEPHNDLESRLHELTSKLTERNNDISKYQSLLDEQRSKYQSELDEQRRSYELKLQEKDSDLLDNQRELRRLSQQLQEMDRLKSTDVALNRKVEEFFAENKRLRKDKEQLLKELRQTEDTLRNPETNFTEVKRLEDERDDLFDKIIKYQEYVQDLEDKLELEQSKSSKLRLELENINQAYSSLQNQNYSSAHSSEAEYNALKKNYEIERSSLLTQMDLLKSEVSSLKSEIQKTKGRDTFSAPLYIENEYRKLSTDYSNLQRKLKEYEDAYNEKAAEFSSLKADLDKKLQQKDTRLRQLEQYRDQDRIEYEREKISLQRERDSLESQYRMKSLEADNIRRDYESKIASLNQDFRTSDTTLQSLLETQVKDLKASNALLTQKLEEQILESNKIKNRNSDVESVADRLEKLCVSLEEDQKQLTEKNQSLSDEVATVKKHCSRLANRLQEQQKDGVPKEDVELLRSNLKMKDKMLQEKELQYKEEKEKLLERYRVLFGQKLDLESRLQDQNNQLPMSPISPSKENHMPDSTECREDSKIAKELTITEKRLQLFQYKLLEKESKLQDLMVTNRVIQLLNQDLSNTLKLHIKQIGDGTGLYPDYSHKRKKLTFKTLAFTVLASVRLKNRLITSQVLKLRFNSIKKEIQQEQLDLV